MRLPCTDAGNIGAPSAGNAGFVVIQTHLSLGFDRTQNKQALHVDATAGGGRSSETSRRISANRILGMATSAIWKATAVADDLRADLDELLFSGLSASSL
jgi:hypothetical protein